MRVTDVNVTRVNGSLRLVPITAGYAGKRRNYRPGPLSFLMLALVLASTIGCGPPSSQGNGGTSGPGGIPEITEEMIRERINDAFVRDVAPQSGSGDPIFWNFDEDEPKEIKVVEKQVNGNRATIVLEIKTRSGPRSRSPRELEGQIRTEWELRTGWVMRRWEIDDTENISMKFRDLPKPPNENSNS